MAESEKDEDWATPHVKKAIAIEGKIWLAVGVVVVVVVLLAAIR